MNFILKVKNKILFIKKIYFIFLEEFFLKERIVKLGNNPLIFDIGYNKGKFSKNFIILSTIIDFRCRSKSIFN